MVDKDRLKDLVGGGSSKGDSDSSKDKNKKRKKSKSKSSNKDTFSGGPSRSGPSNDTEDIKRLLFALANMDAYTRVVKDYGFDGFNRSEEKVKDNFANDVSGEIVGFLGVFDVRDIAEKYGYDWSDVMSIALNNKDMGGDTMPSRDGKVSREDIKDLLDCIANVILYIEGVNLDRSNKNNPSLEDRVIKRISGGMQDQYEEIVSKAEVQKVSERHGYDWENDIIMGVVSDQDFESKIYG